MKTIKVFQYLLNIIDEISLIKLLRKYKFQILSFKKIYLFCEQKVSNDFLPFLFCTLTHIFHQIVLRSVKYPKQQFHEKF